MAAIHLPRTIRIGGGVLNELPAVLTAAGLARPLIVTDAWMVSSGLLERVEALLAAAGIETRAFTKVVPDPTVASVEAGCAFLVQGVTTFPTQRALHRLGSLEALAFDQVLDGLLGWLGYISPQ